MTRPVALIICDGWGINPRREANAIAMAHTPHFDELASRWPHTALHTSGLAVGLPEGQMGNSEVGHMNMGAGRIVYQELTRIDEEIRQGRLQANEVLVAAMEAAKAGSGTLHLMGLLSDGGVHSSLDHALALLRMAKERGVPRTFVHAFLDGRDVPPRSAQGYLARTEAEMQALGYGRVATVSGRYYVMDRDQNWDRVEPAYRALAEGLGPRAESAAEALAASYEADVSDEFFKPVVLDPAGTMRDGDAVIFFNFRPDRARQITRALTDPAFTAFERPQFPRLHYACLTQYDGRLPLPVAYKPQALSDNLAEVLAARGLRQYHTAETEKYAHVTFFFNCGREAPYEGEERLLVASPKIATYDLQPEMSAPAVAQAAAEAAGQTDFLVVNFANADMVGHTGNMDATVKAIEAVDAAVGRVVQAVLAAGGVALVTADHGNAEQMVDYATGQPHTAHTTNPVPLYMAGLGAALREDGVLADVAPTVLDLLGQGVPGAMTARSLLRGGA
ncbi:MAG: 2,3-bisphosphoglycerate-independent phosphoglycerate mutase [Candidatus Sericytochromatia bacterium]|nr:2,3-bisphosphoglycerate-independent phosphoglycerate mutase [Candidatus Sericytochromatia bacterium]